MPRPATALALSVAATVAATDAAVADVVFDALDAGTDEIAFFGDLVLEDLQVDGGGWLRTVTVSLTADGTGGAVATDLTLSLALDGGDGMPDVAGPGDDAILFQAAQTGVVVPRDGTTEVAFDVSDLFVVIPVDALLFGGVQATNPEVGHVFHGAPTVGSTSPFVVSFGAMGPVPAPGTADPLLEQSDALGFRIEADALPAGTPRSGIAGTLIDFEALGEQVVGPTLAVGDATFDEARDGFPPPVDASFAVDDGTGVWLDSPGMLDFVEGKLLNLGGFSGGPDGFLFTAGKSLRITPDVPRTGARVSVAYVAETDDVDYRPSVITLLAFESGVPVASASVNASNVLGTSAGGTFTFGAQRLELAGVTFDELRLFTNGPGPFGGLLMGLDRVLLGDATCPGDLDADGEVAFADLVALLAQFDVCGGTACDADLDADGDVDFEDLVALLAAWGPCR